MREAVLPSRPDRAPLLVLALGILVTAGVVWLLLSLTLARERQQFDSASGEAQAAVLKKVETSVALLRGTAGLFASKQSPVTVDAFAAYVNRLALRERYPGLLGIGFAQRVEPEDEASLAVEMREEGHAGFHVWPEPSGELRTAITFLEPLDVRNRTAIGYDMATNPIRREAMERARDEARVAASRVVDLVQEIDEERQPGFLIYLPVYRGGGIPPSVEERRRLLVGFAYSPIRAVDFLSSAFAHESSPVGMSIYHDATGVLLYRSGHFQPHARFQRSSVVEVEGQRWRFDFRSAETWLEAIVIPAIAGAVGVVLSALLAVLVARERRASRRAQAALAAERAARGDAEAANRAKDDFLATLSHELRTPLHAIIGWTSLMRMPSLREEQRRQGIEVIDRNARAQARLIDDLLDMSRIASGKLSLDLAPVELASIVHDVANSMRPRFEEKRVALEVSVPCERCVVLGDAARLAQVVTNLLSNALKFTPPGGRVDVAVTSGGPDAHVVVADTGEGIEPQFIGRLFDRFSQADASASRTHGGLGLGLSIVRQLVELHHGRIEAHSEGRGRGATFEVAIPLASAEADARAAPADAAAPAGLQGVRVLVVDDDADAREFVQALLVSHGAAVRTAPSAAEALESVRRERFDVMLSDVGMPGMDGHQLMRAVRRMPPAQGGEVAAAAITAYARESDRQAAIDAGFDAHIAKPLQGEALVRTVAALAGKNHHELRRAG